LQIVGDVVDVLEAHGQADHALADARRLTLRLGEATM
jgi:hypothetical protein